jgi:hypothetical protein
MGEIYWESTEWTARYVTVETPVGLLMRLLPGSLKRKEDPPMPREPEDWPPV